MPLTLNIPGPLLMFTGGQRTVLLASSPQSLREALNDLFVCYPGLRDRVLTERGTIREHVNVFVGKEDVRYLAGLETTLENPVEISIVPAVSGGL
jgi:molybdopterin converting factor small subunit